MTPTWPYPILRLKPGKEALLSKRHPWVFSGALQEAPQTSLVRLADASGNVLAVGTASPSNPLAVRLFRFEDAPLDSDFFRTYPHRDHFIDAVGHRGCCLVAIHADHRTLRHVALLARPVRALVERGLDRPGRLPAKSRS